MKLFESRIICISNNALIFKNTRTFDQENVDIFQSKGDKLFERFVPFDDVPLFLVDLRGHFPKRIFGTLLHGSGEPLVEGGRDSSYSPWNMATKITATKN